MGSPPPPPPASLNAALRLPGFDHLRAAAAPLPLARAQLCRLSGEASSDGLSPGAHGPQGVWGLGARPRGEAGSGWGKQRLQEPRGPCPLPWDEESLVQGGPKLALLLAFDSGAFSPVGLLFSLGIALNTETVPPRDGKQ